MRGLSAIATPGQRPRSWVVLAVEPDAAVRTGLVAELGALGCAVVAVATTAEAVTRLMVPDRTYDVVVTDLAATDEATAGLVGAVPAVGVLAAVGPTPVIAYTETVGRNVVEWALAAGAAAVAPRAEGAAGLLAVIARVVGMDAHDLAALPSGSADLAGTADFPALLRRVLQGLQAHMPMGLWMLTRVDGDDWVVIDAVGDAYDIGPGSILRWSESFCSRMVRGQGPRIVASVEDVRVYADAPIAEQIPIGCYVGMPIAFEGRGLFGTLCAIDPSPGDVGLAEDQWALELLATTLSSALAIELERASLDRRLREAPDRDLDPLTGLATRRTWDRLLRVEEARSARTGEHAAVILLDVRGLGQVNARQGHAAGDAVLRRAAAAIRRVVTLNEIGVHLGAGRFGVMAVGRAPETIDGLADGLAAALSAEGIDAAMGQATRGDGITLADAAMLAGDLVAREKSRGSSLGERG